MDYTIKAGNHRAFPTLGLYIDKKVITRKVIFDQSCRYTLPNGDQEDVNKLFGIGYFWSHHTDSARFGWSYNPFSDKIDILSYCYVDGERVITYLTSIDFDKEYKLSLYVNKGAYKFTIAISENDNLTTVYGSTYKTHKKVFGFPLGLYFGGNNPAPHNMIINITK